LTQPMQIMDTLSLIPFANFRLLVPVSLGQTQALTGMHFQ
jgi:hypothetical protein